MASDALGDKRHKIAVRNDQWRSQKVRDHRDDPPFEAELGQVFVRLAEVFSSGRDQQMRQLRPICGGYSLPFESRMPPACDPDEALPDGRLAIR